MRAALRRKGVRYRSYGRIAGVKVDLLLPDLHTVVMVHGCFWHGCPSHYTPPSGNSTFWLQKLRQNKERDMRQARAIKAEGWQVVTVWEHSLSTEDDADGMVRKLLSGKAGVHPSAGD